MKTFKFKPLLGLITILTLVSFTACSDATEAPKDGSKVKKETFKDVEVKDGKTITTTEYQYEEDGKVVGKGRTIEKEVTGGKVKKTQESHSNN